MSSPIQGAVVIKSVPTSRRHYHAASHLKISLPYSTYGLDVIAYIGIQREREHKQFQEIHAQLNQRGVAINGASVGRQYRLFLALMAGAWPQRQARLQEAVDKHGGLILMADGLQPEEEGPQLYVLWEVLSGTPISGVLLERSDTEHLSDWLQQCRATLESDRVLATLSDNQKALVTGLKTVWPQAPHQLCQMHFLENLSEPLHEDDQALRQCLKEHLRPLPAVPDLSAVAAGKTESRAENNSAPGQKKGICLSLTRKCS